MNVLLCRARHPPDGLLLCARHLARLAPQLNDFAHKRGCVLRDSNVDLRLHLPGSCKLAPERVLTRPARIAWL
jgi:hypothetical protein